MPVIRPVIDRPENWRETSERHVVALRTRFREEFYDDQNILLCHGAGWAAEFSGMYAGLASLQGVVSSAIVWQFGLDG